MNKVIVIVILILLGAAYVGGYWPQHRQLVAAQESASQAQAQLAGAQSVARICHLENDLLALIGQTENQNFGNARNLSNTFFDNLRREADRDPKAPYDATLDNILGQRDSVTAGLARTDSSTAATLRQILAQMQGLMQKLD
jgi:type II secretory pathway pseudopilin PulG